MENNFIISEIKDWKAYLSEQDEQADVNLFKHANNGRPLGDDKFIKAIEVVCPRNSPEFAVSLFTTSGYGNDFSQKLTLCKATRVTPCDGATPKES